MNVRFVFVEKILDEKCLIDYFIIIWLLEILMKS